MELDDKNPEFILNRGGVYLDLGKYERAIDDYSSALALNTRSAAAYAGRAKGYQGSGAHDKALADFAKLLEIEPNSAAALYGMGISYKAGRQDEKAVEAFDKVLKVEPKHAGASYQKAGIYARSKKIDAACVWLDIAVGDGYRDWDALKNDPDFDALRKNSCYQKVIAGK
jgi:tetratricopeptide (TPR) repeat protein